VEDTSFDVSDKYFKCHTLYQYMKYITFRYIRYLDSFFYMKQKIELSKYGDYAYKVDYTDFNDTYC